MKWINENAGVIVLVTAIIIIVLAAICVWLLFHIKNRIAVQRLSFLGFWSTSMDTGKRYADFTVGNKSLHTVGVQEIGLKNGSVSVSLTDLYREKASLPSDAKPVVAQRGSLTFRLTEEELKKICGPTKGERAPVRTLRVYVVDVAGTLYQGKVGAVKKLLKALLAEEAGKTPEQDPLKTDDAETE